MQTILGANTIERLTRMGVVLLLGLWQANIGAVSAQPQTCDLVDEICDTGAGETHLNCPEDCSGCDDYYDCNYGDVCVEGSCTGCNSDPGQCQDYWDENDPFCYDDPHGGWCSECADCAPLGCNRSGGFCDFCDQWGDCADGYFCGEGGACMPVPR